MTVQQELHEEFKRRRQALLDGKAPYARGGKKNALKTHCAKGHEFTFENTHYVKSGENLARQCKACKKSCNDERYGNGFGVLA